MKRRKMLKHNKRYRGLVTQIRILKRFFGECLPMLMNTCGNSRNTIFSLQELEELIDYIEILDEEDQEDLFAELDKIMNILKKNKMLKTDQLRGTMID